LSDRNRRSGDQEVLMDFDLLLISCPAVKNYRRINGLSGRM
jgi:hypothetical protein